MKELRFTLRCNLYSLFILLSLGAIALAVAQEPPTSEKRYVRWRLIEVARKSQADSIWARLQQGVSFQKLARQHSLHASVKQGGEIGWTALDSVPSEFKTVMVSLPIGRASATLQNGNCFFILYKMNMLLEIDYLRWIKQKVEIDSLLKTIKALSNTGNYPAAMALIKEAEEIVKQIEDEKTHLSMLNHKGVALRSLNQFRDAASLFDTMLKISRTDGDPYWTGVALGNLGIVHYRLNQYQPALAHYDSALIIAREIGDRKGEGDWLGRLGNVYYSLSQFPRAIAYYDSALGIAREINDQIEEGENLGNLGAVYDALGRYSQSIAYYDSALFIARQAGDRAQESRHLGNLGLAHDRLGQYPQAIAYYESAMAIAQQLGDRQRVGICLGRLGNVCSSLGQYQRAIAYYDSALGIAKEVGDQRRKGSLFGSLGVAYRLLGQYSQAIAYYDTALNIARTSGDKWNVGRHLGNLGGVYALLGQFQRQIAYYDSALITAREIGNRTGEGKWLGGLGTAYTSLGNYQKALAYSDSALVTAREIGNRPDEGISLGNLGGVYVRLGQYQRAIAYYDSALGIARETGDRNGEGAWLGNLGSVNERLGQYQRAIAYYGSALGIAREIGDRNGEGVWLGNLGVAHERLSQYQQAIAYSDSSLGIAREIGNRTAEGTCLGNLSNTYRLLGQYLQAVAYADSALFVAKETANAERILFSYWSLAQSHSQIPESKINEVINFYDNAVEALEKITGQLIKDEYKLSFLKEKQKLYRDYINYLMAQAENPYHERALEISEASRTRALRDLLQGQRIQAPFAVEKRIAATKRTEELFQKFAGTQIAQADISDALRAGVDDSLESWATKIQIPPDTLGSTEGAPAIRMREIEAEAKSSTLLEYHVLDDGVAIWVLNQSGNVFSVKQNIPKAKLQALIDSARQVLKVTNFADRDVRLAAMPKGTQTHGYQSVLQTLDSLLIQPVARHLPADSSRELVVLPHDILFLLPFACLMDSSGKYLVERYTFSTAPSIGLLKFTRGRIREQQYREKPKLLLMGNPVMPEAKMWPDLPGAEQEVKQIAQHVNQKQGVGFQAQGALPLQALPLTKAQATEAEFRHIAGIQNYLHLATHGYVVSDALRCGLILARTGNTMETDGILTTAEIFGLPLNANLVVLSACQTGLGQISSDGVAGLSRAFLYAGASSLIVSLWKVSDEAAQHLMVRFYEELARDGNKARALRAAQLATMKKYPHPKDWAAFVLVGQPK